MNTLLLLALGVAFPLNTLAGGTTILSTNNANNFTIDNCYIDTTQQCNNVITTHYDYTNNPEDIATDYSSVGPSIFYKTNHRFYFPSNTICFSLSNSGISFSNSLDTTTTFNCNPNMLFGSSTGWHYGNEANNTPTAVCGVYYTIQIRNSYSLNNPITFNILGSYDICYYNNYELVAVASYSNLVSVDLGKSGSLGVLSLGNSADTVISDKLVSSLYVPEGVTFTQSDMSYRKAYTNFKMSFYFTYTSSDVADNPYYISGYNNGVKDGFEDGKKQGRIEGIQQAQSPSVLNNVFSWFSSIGDSFANLLDFEIFPNIKIGYVVLAPLVVGALFALLKVLLG